jgi:hypothetical protein
MHRRVQTQRGTTVARPENINSAATINAKAAKESHGEGSDYRNCFRYIIHEREAQELPGCAAALEFFCLKFLPMRGF